jgi:hypothetical protein
VFVVAPDTGLARSATTGLGPARPAWTGLVPNWPLWIALAVFARLLFQPLALLNDPDTYLHIAAGRWMWVHMAVPTVDPFSHSMPGAPWVPGEWLAEAILAGIYGWASWTGIVIVSAACVAVALALLCRFLIPRTGPLPALVMTLAGAALVFPHTVARAHVLAMPLLMVWSASLVAARDRGTAPRWGLVPVMVLWANLHASFLFGIGLAGWLGAEAVWESQRRWESGRRWGCFVAAAVVAGMMTPSGVTAFLQPLRLMAMPALQTSFGEWLPPSLADFPALELWILAAIGAGFALPVRLRWPRLALLLLLVHMALRHVRHADLLGLVGPLLLAGGLGATLGRYNPICAELPLWRAAARLAGPVRGPALAVTLALAGAVAFPVIAHPITRSDDKATPASAVAAARGLGLAGPVFNGEAFGGYLAFAGVPDFIDGRIEMFGNDFLAADVAAESGDEGALSRLLARYGITWTLLAPEAGAVAVLDRMPGWRRVYADPYAVIHVRAAAAP